MDADEAISWVVNVDLILAQVIPYSFICLTLCQIFIIFVINLYSSHYMKRSLAMMGLGLALAHSPDLHAQEPLAPVGVESFQLDESLDLDINEIASKIDCESVTTLNGEKISDNQLLAILECNEIVNVTMTTGPTAAILTIQLSDGNVIKHQVMLSFAEALHPYLLARGIDVHSEDYETLISKIIPYLTVAVFLLLIGIGIKVSLPQLFGNAGEFIDAKTRFSDIGGLRNVKDSLEDLVQCIKNRHELLEAGMRVPKGALFYGDPGVGKTYIAEAVACESGVPFLKLSAGELKDSLLGGTAKQIKALFARAKKTAKKKGACIVFLDELDSLGTARSKSSNISGADREMDDSLNQLLVEIDNCAPDSGVFIIAATNHFGKLDKALIRPGRFDRRIEFQSLDQEGRIEVLEINMRGLTVEKNINLEAIAAVLVAQTGAAVAGVVEDAKLLASKRGAPVIVTQADLEEAVDFALMGVASDRRLSPEEELRVAVHESGHTIATLLEDYAVVQKVSIVPRGQALGVTVTPPPEEQHLYASPQVFHTVKMFLAGRIAEELKFNNLSTLPGDDLKQATGLVRRMVTELGMVDFPLLEEEDSELIPYRRYAADDPGVSAFIGKVLSSAAAEIRGQLELNQDLLNELVQGLLKQKTLGRDEIAALVAAHPLVKA
jgi:cell division protease FtsH